MKRKPIIASIALLLALGLAAGALTLWKRHKNQQAAHAGGFEPAEAVEVVAASSIPWRETARLVGTVVAVRSVTLAGEIAGTITEVGFDSGDTVEPGQVLIQLDTSTEQADLAAARAEIRAAQTNLELARANLDRFTQAGQSSGAVSQLELDRIRAEVERSQAQAEQAAARATQIETLIAKKTLRAPFRARAGMRVVHPGQYVDQGQQIVQLTELTDTIYLDFAVPQEYAARVKTGDSVQASSRMMGDKPMTITVAAIDATVNPVTRNVRIRASVPNPGYALRPGMFIDVEVPLEEETMRVAVPTSAVRRAAFGDHVFVIGPSTKEGDQPGAMRSSQRIVKLGPDVGGKVVVLEGLKEGEKIAAGGSFKLREGALVIPVEAGAQASQPPHTQEAQAAGGH